MKHGVLVRTEIGTYLTVEFDDEQTAHAFRERLRRHERTRVHLRTAADTIETLEIALARQHSGVQPIVRLSD